MTSILFRRQRFTDMDGMHDEMRTERNEKKSTSKAAVETIARKQSQ